MDEATARRLVALNTEFYQQAAPSFSATRHNSWPGWERVADCVREDLPGNCAGCASLPACNHAMGADGSLDVLDLACGNMRFATFLEDACPSRAFRFHAVDNCRGFEPAPVESPVSFQQLDVMESLMAGTLERDLQAPFCAVAACFAFVHHVPLPHLREELLRVLARRLLPGGLLAVSLWSFMDEPSFAIPAVEHTLQAVEELGISGLEPGDCLLGWQNVPGLWRYCHSFDEDEIDDLAESLEPEARLIRRYRADGRNGKMNAYLLFQRE